MTSLRRLATVVLSGALLVACSSTRSPDGRPEPPREPSVSPSSSAATPTPTPTPVPAPTTAPVPVSIAALKATSHRGSRLRLGAVRERTASYTSYDVTYRAATGQRSFTISGVLNVPTGRGPFPAVVLAHGYIDPAYYVRGQGMTRERGVFATRGYVALHVDYRGHAESTDDPRSDRDLRLGYSADVIGAVKALRASEVNVDSDRIALMGRSMGGGVVMKALIAEPGLVQAAALWASVSSLEAENFDQFIRPDGDSRAEAVVRAHGLPEDEPAFWRAASARPYLGEITEPVLMAHGRFDDTCPPPWARATQAAMRRAGVESTLEWYDDGHAFGPAFLAAMDRTIRYLDRQLGR
ncbi:alpha/beta hydrolase family protein [Nocardioides sp.]|uniref:alpha/beta hydrolase family protein n=1 Tax=Nocardioides sp. TaxID=35761 RepID=UPI002BE8EF94|nr:prolyl oligopeptidase family serine peptidase [Nocardioides sp.]HXH79825.1 prolyl oligopeptidase family serine peptidase [Nocardioides sp.]